MVCDLELSQKTDAVFACGKETQPRKILPKHSFIQSLLAQKRFLLLLFHAIQSLRLFRCHFRLNSSQTLFLHFMLLMRFSLSLMPLLLQEDNFSLQKIAHFLEETLGGREDVVCFLYEGETQHEENAWRISELVLTVS